VNRRRSSKGFVTVFTLGMLYVLLSIDWRGHKPARPPRVALFFQATGAFSAGAARVDLRPRLPTPVAGYPPPRPIASESGPLFARALVLRAGERSVGLASAEVLEIPEPVARAVREKGRALGLSDVVVTATHTHTSFGGYDERLVARIAATGHYDEALEQHLIAKLVEALVKAQGAIRPASVKVAQTALAGISANRDAEGGAVDDRLSAIELDDAQGAAIARVVGFGSHATLTARDTKRLEGDWPGWAMEKLEEKGGVAILLQGAVGDASSRPPEGPGTPAERMGARVAQAASEALSGRPQVAGEPGFAFAAVEISLPRAEADNAVPSFLRRPAANILHAVAPRKAEVALIRLPGLTLVCLPVEPTAGAAKIVRERIFAFVAKDEAVAIVSLAQGYLGYVEDPAVVREGKGEAKRMLFEPELLERLALGVVTGMEATEAAKAGPRMGGAP